MEDISSRIKRLNSYKKTNFIGLLIVLIYGLFVIIWTFPQAKNNMEWVFLSYLVFNAAVCFFLMFNNLKIGPENQFPDNPEKYLDFQIERTIYSNDLAPIFLFPPLIFGLIGIYFIDLNYDKEVEVWIYIIQTFLILYALIRFYKMRRLLRKEYKRIHGIDFLSFFHF